MKYADKKNFHIPLSEETYAELRQLAEAVNQPATRIAREAIEYWLHAQKKRLLRSEIEQYARANSGGRMDLDPDLEAAGIEHMIKEKKRK